ncbi:SCO4983 family protein [Actinacidiphila soli]|uniref:SCO4983 family protein n=1 Tax=Actinacidiphila soli TaxID=2487275 RepID=UPI000FCBCF6D|nr:hypothetical protein [Actinacidiphila soli]
MYEPIRTKSVHSVAATSTPATPRRSRGEELDFQLAGHLAALLTVTDELRALAPGDDLGSAAEQLAECVERLRNGVTPARLPPATAVAATPDRIAALHRRAQALAGRALVVAASRQDTASAVLAAQRLDAHDAALAAAA